MLVKVVLLVLLFLLAFLGLVASVVVLVVGLAKRRRRVWRTAIVTAALSVMLGASGGLWVAYKSLQHAKRFVESANSPESGPGEAEMQAWISASLGHDLPEGLRCVRGRREEPVFPPLYTWYVIMQVEPSARERVREWLAGPDFRRSTSHNVDRPMDAAPPPQYWQRGLPPWPHSQMRGGDYYELQNDAGCKPDHIFVTKFLYDDDSGMLYYVRAEGWN